MPTFKLKGQAKEQKSGFEPYDGPVPARKGLYRGVIKSMKHGANNSGSSGFAIVIELEAAPGDPKDHAIYDGYPMFSRSIITEGKDGATLKEGAQRNLDNLLAALNAGDNPDVVLEQSDDDKVNVLKIGGRNPIGAVVNVEVGFRVYEGEREPEVSGIWPYKEIDGPAKKATSTVVVEDEEEDEADLLDEAEGQTLEERAEELAAMSVAELRALAKNDYDLQSSGTKQAVIDRILTHEFEDVEPEDEDEPEDEPEDEVDEPEEDEAEDDEAEEEDEEADEEDDEGRAEREAELAELNRVAIKSILKEIAPDFTVLKKHTDDDLRAQVLSVEFADDLPF